MLFDEAQLISSLEIPKVNSGFFSSQSDSQKIRKHVSKSSRTIFRLRSGNCLRTGTNSGYLPVGRTSALR